jgi:hypothetical protein
MAQLTRRGTRIIVVGIVFIVAVVAVVLGARALWTTAKKTFASDSCTIGSYDLDADQAATASTMVGAVTQHPDNLSERATVLVLAAALQESKLTNIPAGSGDRDSVGVLQQRPSQGWGKVTGQTDTIAARTQRLTDVGEATKEFLDHLVKVENWQKLPLAEAVQDVQVSADGSAYAQHEPEAQAIADALQGRVAAGITCSFDAPTKVASPAQVAAQAADQLGINTPKAAGRTVRVPGAHWQTASWFVANADRLGIEQVDYAGRRWTRTDGWKKNPKISTAAVVATMYRAK